MEGGAQGGIGGDRQGLEWVRDMGCIAMLWQKGASDNNILLRY